MRNILLLLTAVLFTFFYSCRSKEDPDVSCIFDEGVVQGTLSGNSWTFREGTAKVFTEEFQIFLYQTSEITSTNLCTENTSNLTGTQITFFVDDLIGTQFDKQATIYNATTTDTDVVLISCLEVDEITSSSITGRIAFSANGNAVDGSYTATICN